MILNIKIYYVLIFGNHIHSGIDERKEGKKCRYNYFKFGITWP